MGSAWFAFEQATLTRMVMTAAAVAAVATATVTETPTNSLALWCFWSLAIVRCFTAEKSRILIKTKCMHPRFTKHKLRLHSLLLCAHYPSSSHTQFSFVVANIWSNIVCVYTIKTSAKCLLHNVNSETTEKTVAHRVSTSCLEYSFATHSFRLFTTFYPRSPLFLPSWCLFDPQAHAFASQPSAFLFAFTSFIRSDLSRCKRSSKRMCPPSKSPRYNLSLCTI